MSFKVFAASTLAGMSFIADAGSMGDIQTGTVFDGYYIGAGAGLVNMFSESTIFNNPSTFGVIPITLSQLQYKGDTGFSAASIRANLGYGKTFDQAGYVGAELSYRYAPVHGGNVIVNNTNIPTYVNGRPVNDGTLSLRGGYLFVPGVLTYGLVGVSATQFNYQFTDFVSALHYLTKTQWGITPGIGMEVSLSKSITMDLRYTYSAYGQTSQTVKANIILDGTGDNYDLFNTTPTVHAASLTFNYHFS